MRCSLANARARARLFCDHRQRPHLREPLQFVGKPTQRRFL
jgi:hypothetical protein